jgi:hypothetical protein
MGEQRAVAIWRRDTHRDNPVTMEESAYGEQRAVTIWRRDTHRDNPVTMEESAYGEQRAVTMWRRKDTHRDNPVTMEERKSLMGEQETAIIIEVTYRGAVCCHYKG